MPTQTAGKIKNTTYLIEGEPVTLVNGVAEYQPHQLQSNYDYNECF